MTLHRSSLLSRLATPFTLCCLLLAIGNSRLAAQNQPVVPSPDKPAEPAKPGEPGAPPAPETPPAVPAQPEPMPAPAPIVPSEFQTELEDAETRTAAAETLRKLSQPLTVDMADTPLRDALAFIADKVGVDVVGDWKSLETVGVNQDTPINLKITRPAPAQQALQWIARAAGGENISFAIEGGVIRVSRRDVISRMLVVRSYDIRDLREGDAPDAIIKTLIAPASWAGVTPEIGAPSMYPLEGRLLIVQTEANHRQIEKLLKLLREKPSTVATPK